MELETTHVREIRVSYTPTSAKRFAVSHARHVADFVRSVLTDNSREHFVALYLDGSHTVASYSVVAIGSANACSVHPREVFQRAVLAGACSVVVAHNHPSGNTEPSEDDWRITERLQDAGRMLGIKVLDHVIVTDDAAVSLAGMARWV